MYDIRGYSAKPLNYGIGAILT